MLTAPKRPLLLAIATLLDGIVAAAASELSTVELNANNLTFTCTQLSTVDATQNVVLLHGFPMRRSWYNPLLNAWYNHDSLSINALACDLRGYSPGASPESISEYQYDFLVSDIFALAVAAGFDDFHLVGHDHGAGVGWVAASQSQGQILSYTAMSVPHVDRFSASLCGEEEVQEQAVASNYFNQFSIADSATVNDGRLTALFASFGAANVSAPQELQKQLWWYNASIPFHISLPRVVNDSEVPEDLILLIATRQAIPLEPRPCIPQRNPIGVISIPVLFICGAKDPYLLCTLPFTIPGDDLVPDYTYYEAETCQHDFFLEGDCDNITESEKVIMQITYFITSEGPTSTSGGNMHMKSGISVLSMIAFLAFAFTHSKLD
jgi:pimeloyl-ACP methyl ester carboxylesterase